MALEYYNNDDQQFNRFLMTVSILALAR